MRTLNSKKNFEVGKMVEVIRPYILGNILIDVGKIGTIVGFQLVDVPDMMLWDVKVWDIDFDGEIISAAEEILKTHVRLI